MVDEVNIIRFKAKGDPRGRVHTGIQMKGSDTAKPLCRDQNMKIGEVVLNCQDLDECTLCKIKRFDLRSKHGSLRIWVDKEGFVVRSDMVGK